MQFTVGIYAAYDTMQYCLVTTPKRTKPTTDGPIAIFFLKVLRFIEIISFAVSTVIPVLFIRSCLGLFFFFFCSTFSSLSSIWYGDRFGVVFEDEMAYLSATNNFLFLLPITILHSDFSPSHSKSSVFSIRNPR